MKMDLMIGTYSQPILFGTGEVFCGKGEGLYLCSFDGEVIQVKTVLPMMNPSYLAVDEERGKVYAVNEGKEFHGVYGGGITEVNLQRDGTLHEVTSYPTQGTDPCHVAIHPSKQWIGVANFADGSVSFFDLDDHGSLTGICTHFQHEGSGPHSIRQKGPHAHSVVFDTEGHAYVPDLGIDKLMCYDVDYKDIRLNTERTLTLAPGSGPRFAVFHNDDHFLYVINELASTVSHFTWCEDRFVYGKTISTLPKETTVSNICSDIHITPDGHYLYASNRGHDSITAFSICSDGDLKWVGNYACHGKTPRNFAISPDGTCLLVGNQDSDTISVYRIDKDGSLTWIRNIDFPTPVCIQFLQKAWSI